MPKPSLRRNLLALFGLYACSLVVAAGCPNAVPSKPSGAGAKTADAENSQADSAKQTDEARKLEDEARAKVDIRMVPNQDPERMLDLVRQHLDRHGFSDIEIQRENTYKWAKSTVDAPPVKALLRTYREFGIEPEVWPHLGGSAPFYLFSDTLGIPFAFGGLGHGGRVHSPNEYATVAGMRDHEKATATFLYRLAEELAACDS